VMNRFQEDVPVLQQSEVVQEIFGKETPVIGFYTHGEIGPIDKTHQELKAARGHNQTVGVYGLKAKGLEEKRQDDDTY